MKNHVILFAVLFCGCGRTIVDPAAKTYTKVVNDLNSPVQLKLYSLGHESQSVMLQYSQSFEWLQQGDFPGEPPFQEFDSASLGFANGIKMDRNCLNLGDSLGTICNKDSISLFKESCYSFEKINSHQGRWTYNISARDSAEAKP